MEEPENQNNLESEIWSKLKKEKKIPEIKDLANVIKEIQFNNKKEKISHETEQKEQVINKLKYPRTAKKVLLMLKQLYETGFASFA